MKNWVFKDVYVPGCGWQGPVQFDVDTLGHLQQIHFGNHIFDKKGQSLSEICQKTAKAQEPQTMSANPSASIGWLIPGAVSAHAHSFQYAMAGAGELRKKADDSFWSWREAMYDLALRLDPDDFEAIAAMGFSEMLRLGYTRVIEFHYLHHDREGKPYSNPAEMCERLESAANQTGIELRIVPILYQKGGFGADPKPEQRRFICSDLDLYFKIVTSSQNYGMGVHSLRAVDAVQARTLLNSQTDRIRHIHLAEQPAEVEACKTHLGMNPLAWILREVQMSPRLSLVHVTHTESEELAALAKSETNVVLCPSTEANLGDGFFPIESFAGHWTIGSDSQICLSPFEELRWLDYGARLRTGKRLPGTPMNTYAGEALFDQAIIGGLGSYEGRSGVQPWTIGYKFDGLVLDEQHPSLMERPREQRLSALIFAADSSALRYTIVGARIHEHNDAVVSRYRQTLRRLLR